MRYNQVNINKTITDFKPKFKAVICKDSSDFADFIRRANIPGENIYKYKIVTKFEDVKDIPISNIYIDFHGFREDFSWIDIYNKIASANGIKQLSLKKPATSDEIKMAKSRNRHNEISSKMNKLNSQFDRITQTDRFGKDYGKDYGVGYGTDSETLADQFLHRTEKIINAPTSILTLIFNGLKKFSIIKALRFVTEEIREKQKEPNKTEEKE